MLFSLRRFRTLATGLLSCGLAVNCFAWSLKEHILLTRIAAEELIADPATPPAMKDWLKAANRSGHDMEGEKDFLLHQRVGLFPRAVDGLGFWGGMPDLDKTVGKAGLIEPFGLPENQLHFTDLEFLNADETKRTYMDDLSHKPKLEDVPRDLSDPRWKKAGMLPFRVEDVYKKLVADIKAGKLTDKMGQFPRDEHAEHWAGYLAHYLEDNCQPQHSTVDYMSRTYFGKDNLRPPNIHSDVEYVLVDADQDDYLPIREEFWNLFVKDLGEVKDTTVSNDPWAATMEVLMKSYDCLPLIGRAGLAGYHMGGTPEAPTGHPSATFDADAFYHYKGKVDGVDMTILEMKAHQMAWAVKRVERMWLQAWNEGTK